MPSLPRVLVFLGLGVLGAAESPVWLSAQAPASPADRFLVSSTLTKSTPQDAISSKTESS